MLGASDDPLTPDEVGTAQTTHMAGEPGLVTEALCSSQEVCPHIS